MKKVFSLLLLLGCIALIAGVETVNLPLLDQWKKAPGAKLQQKREYLIPSGGNFSLSRKFPAKYGETIELVLLYSGQGRLRFRLNEYNKRSIRTASTVKSFFNTKDEIHSRSLFYAVSRKDTVAFTLELIPADNKNMGAGKIFFRRLYGEENKIYSPYLNRELWKERTLGKNLALGKKVFFLPKPNYSLTAERGTDLQDLTDGKLSTKYDDYIWFDPAAVGWRDKSQRRLLSIDLGKVKNVSKAVVRICGGRINGDGTAWFPSLIEVWVSKDGSSWYPVTSLKKVKISEKLDADWKSLYYLPETNQSLGQTFVYPFELKIDAEARYVGLGFSNSGFLLMDEIAVMEGKNDAEQFNAPYTREKDLDLFSLNAKVEPFYPEFYIHRGDLHLPTMLRLNDRREVKKGTLSYFIDLPEQVSYTEGLGYPAFTRKLVRTEKKNGRTIRYFQCKYKSEEFVLKTIREYHIGPFYFRAEKEIPPAERYVRIGTSFGKAPASVVRKYKLNIIDIPRARQPEKLLTSFTWFAPRITAYWPEFGKSAQYIGINGTGWFTGQIPPGRRENFIKDLQKHRVRIAGVPRINITRLAKGSTEYLCISSKRSKLNQVCPSYRGKYYKLFCETTAAALKDEPLDLIHMDYEFWFEPEAFQSCSRCNELRKSKKMNWGEFTEWVMADFYRGVLRAVRKVKPKLVIGSYLYCLNYKTRIGQKQFSIFGTGLLFPSDLDEVQISYYGSNPRMVRERVRENYLLVRDPAKVNIYLTGGAGAYGSDRMYDMVIYQMLEAYMNGAYSIAYYIDASFSSPLDFKYLADGLNLVVPHEDFLMKAKLDPAYSGSEKSLFYTYRFLGKKALILIGNYENSKPVRTFLPLKNVRTARECISSRSLKVGSNGVTITVPAGKSAFVEVLYR